MTRLATAQAEGSTDWFPVAAPGHLYKSHLRTLYVYGTFGGANVSLEISPDGGVTSFAVANADTITVKTAINVEFRATHARIVVGAGTAEAIDAFLY